MYGYLLQKPQSLPETVWACKTAVNDYAWENRNSSDMIELSLCTADSRAVQIPGASPILLRGTTLSCVVGDKPWSSAADTGVLVEITTVAVRFPSLSAQWKEIEEADLQNPSVLLLPALLELSSKRVLSEIEQLFHKYIHAYVDRSAPSELLCHAALFDLLYRADALTRSCFGAKKQAYTNYYVIKTEAMITQRYTERLTLYGVAAELRITPGYLSAVYKAATGVSFSDRLGEVRLARAKELLHSTTLSVSEIAVQVGFGEESVLRKHFKRVMGIGIREYRCIVREQTLYHTKPQRQKADPAE